jgi:ubiquinone/menaquinone biosynthesis C-methylase UbiE
MTVPVGTHAWQDPERTRRFLSGTRAAIPLAAEQLDTMLFVIQQALVDVQSILDVGAGSGILSRILLERYPQAHTVLVDFSEPMLEAARQQFSDEQAAIFKGDLNQPDWIKLVQAYAPFDVAVSGYAIHHLLDERKRSLYREIHELLKPGGIFVNIEHVASPSPWVESLFIESFADNLYAATAHEGYTRQQIVERLHEDDGDICASVEDQCAWLRAIGYQDVDCYMKIYAFAVFGGLKQHNGKQTR